MAVYYYVQNRDIVHLILNLKPHRDFAIFSESSLVIMSIILLTADQITYLIESKIDTRCTSNNEAINSSTLYLVGNQSPLAILLDEYLGVNSCQDRISPPSTRLPSMLLKWVPS